MKEEIAQKIKDLYSQWRYMKRKGDGEIEKAVLLAYVEGVVDASLPEISGTPISK